MKRSRAKGVDKWEDDGGARCAPGASSVRNLENRKPHAMASSFQMREDDVLGIPGRDPTAVYEDKGKP
jgi:hypothetical protein